MGHESAALSIRNLTKRYNDGTLALDGLDLDVPAAGGGPDVRAPKLSARSPITV